MKKPDEINESNVLDFLYSQDFDDMVKYANWQLIEPLREALKKCIGGSPKKKEKKGVK